MKKLFILFLLSLFIQPIFAANIDVLPTMQTRSNVQDKVWVASFQLVWNKFMERVAYGDIRLADGSPEYVAELNKKEVTEDEISKSSYYIYWGKLKKNTTKKISKALKKKFKTNSELLDQVVWEPHCRKFLIYSMLKKDFKFKQEFDDLGVSDFRYSQAKFWGINSHSKNSVRDNVFVLFYNSPEDYAVKLVTKANDEVFLYKTHSTKTFANLYNDMFQKQELYSGNKFFQNNDELKVPYLKFFEEKSYSELEGKRVKGTNMFIEKALQSVDFEMNNTGVQLKSEAFLEMMTTSLLPQDEYEPRHFYFDDTFVIFIRECNKKLPYFALRVYDISKFQ